MPAYGDGGHNQHTTLLRQPTKRCARVIRREWTASDAIIYAHYKPGPVQICPSCIQWLATPNSLLHVVRLPLAGLHLSAQLGDVDENLLAGPAHRHGDEENISFGVVVEQQMHPLANLLELGTSGPPADRRLGTGSVSIGPNESAFVQHMEDRVTHPDVLLHHVNKPSFLQGLAL